MTTNWTIKSTGPLLGWVCLFNLFFGSYAAAQSNVEFRLSCKVMDNIIIAAEEGRPKRYTHYVDGFVLGDTLDFLVELRPNDSLYLRLRDTIRDKVIVGTVKSSDEIVYWSGEMDYLATSQLEVTTRLGIHKNDSINIDSDFLDDETLKLKRYYKDDWQGLLVQNREMTAQVAVLDCRASSPSNLAEITGRLKAVVKKME